MKFRDRNPDSTVLRHIPVVVIIPVVLVSVALTATSASAGWWLVAGVLVTLGVVGVIGTSIVKALQPYKGTKITRPDR